MNIPDEWRPCDECKDTVFTSAYFAGRGFFCVRHRHLGAKNQFDLGLSRWRWLRALRWEAELAGNLDEANELTRGPSLRPGVIQRLNDEGAWVEFCIDDDTFELLVPYRLLTKVSQ